MLSSSPAAATSPQLSNVLPACLPTTPGNLPPSISTDGSALPINTEQPACVADGGAAVKVPADGAYVVRERVIAFGSSKARVIKAGSYPVQSQTDPSGAAIVNLPVAREPSRLDGLRARDYAIFNSSGERVASYSPKEHPQLVSPQRVVGLRVVRARDRLMVSGRLLNVGGVFSSPRLIAPDVRNSAVGRGDGDYERFWLSYDLSSLQLGKTYSLPLSAPMTLPAPRATDGKLLSYRVEQTNVLLRVKRYKSAQQGNQVAVSVLPPARSVAINSEGR
jgi:hypothetical protein